jgi:hypothetical protein
MEGPVRLHLKAAVPAGHQALAPIMVDGQFTQRNDHSCPPSFRTFSRPLGP